MPLQIATATYEFSLKQAGYNQIRKNKVTQRIEVDGHDLDDDLAATIRTDMRHMGFKNMAAVMDALMAIGYSNAYHPILEYFGSLPPYDGKKYFDQLCACFTNADGLFPHWLRKWMIGAVAKAFQKAQNPMLVLDGLQGIGKSKFANWLCSGTSKYFVEAEIDTNNKDTFILLTNRWIWEVSELSSSMRRSDREALKTFITQGEVTVRHPYGRFETTVPALASMIGTINNESGILNDPTGSRRFLIAHIEKIDWKEYLKIDVDYLWSEIYSAYLADEPWTLTNAEETKRDDNNNTYETPDPLESAFPESYRIDSNRLDWWVSTHEIMNRMKGIGLDFHSPRAFEMELARLATKLKLKKTRVLKNGVQQSGYIGIRDVLLP